MFAILVHYIYFASQPKYMKLTKMENIWDFVTLFVS